MEQLCGTYMMRHSCFQREWNQSSAGPAVQPQGSSDQYLQRGRHILRAVNYHLHRQSKKVLSVIQFLVKGNKNIKIHKLKNE